MLYANYSSNHFRDGKHTGAYCTFEKISAREAWRLVDSTRQDYLRNGWTEVAGSRSDYYVFQTDGETVVVKWGYCAFEYGTAEVWWEKLVLWFLRKMYWK